jgi:hypothetical protein
LLAYLLVGNIGPELYGGDDVALLVLLAGLIAPQVGSFLRVQPARPFDSAQGGPTPATPVNSAPAHDASAELLIRIASLLATTSDPSAATRLIAEEGSGLLPFQKLTFALRLTEGDRVIVLQPGERRALPDLPLVVVTGTALARVLQGQATHSFAQARGRSRLMVPLRVAGRIHGALVFDAALPAALAESHLESAQRLADIVAAHLELLRRAAMP